MDYQYRRRLLAVMFVFFSGFVTHAYWPAIFPFNIPDRLWYLDPVHWIIFVGSLFTIPLTAATGWNPNVYFPTHGLPFTEFTIGLLILLLMTWAAARLLVYGSRTSRRRIN